MPNHLFARIPLGLRYMLLSTLGFALMTACVKQVSTYNIPIFEIVAARALVSLILSYYDIRRKGISPWGNHRLLLIARGAVGSFALICTYYAVMTLPLAEATVLQYLHPVFTAVLAWLFLKEKIQRSTFICILLSISGLIVLIEPGTGTSGGHTLLPSFSVLVAIGGAFGSSIAYVLVRRLSRVEDSSVIIFYFPIVTLPIALLLLGDDFVMPNLPAFFLLILIGIFTQLGQVGLTNAMRADEAAKVSAYSYMQVVFSAVIGWVYFDEIPVITTVIGGGLIILGALINVMGSRYFSRKLKLKDS